MAFRNLAFLKSVKGKILLGFLLASIALGTSWIISKKAFQTMLDNLETMSTPDDKLRMVNKIFRNILQLDQLQNTRTLKGQEKSEQVLAQSKELIATLDSLNELSIGDDMQMIRIDSMKTLLKAREKIYGKYVKVRSKLVDNKDLEDEVKNISGLITTKLKPDSTACISCDTRTLEPLISPWMIPQWCM